ncbi:hypothetical protein V498_06757 [Pseudogymnoascus sp. VKM F-4517 (FW-2822)]|nr:hypothetical protein V498_06757 [Pseudogymnoascus sp. VKM F-4517 (FW-2822)]
MASEDDSGLTLLGPLTTIFTPPATCLDLTVLSISTVFKTVVTVTSTLSDGSAVSVSTISTVTTSKTAYLEKYDYILDGSCYPPNYTTYSAYYSPGRCPSAWEGVITTAQNNETTVQCCPTSFTFSGELCRSSISAMTTPVVLYKNQLRVDPTPTPSFIPEDDIVWATGIVVRYRDGDFDTTTTDAKTSVAKSTIATPTNTAPPASDDSDSGLSLGGKVGLGVGIPAAALVLAVLAFFFFRRRRSATVATAPQQPSQELHAYSQPPPQQYYQPMQQSTPAGYYEAKPSEMARASEIYTSSAAGSPRFQRQSTGYAPVAQYYQPMQQSTPAGYYEAKPSEMARASEIYTSSAAGSPRFQRQSTGYAPVAQVGAYAPADGGMGYAPVVGSGQAGYEQEARAPSAAGGYAPAASPGYGQDVSAPIAPSQRQSSPPVEGAPRQWSGGGGPLPDPAELYPEYGAAGDDDVSIHGRR